MILWPPLFGLWGGPWPLGPPPKYAYAADSSHVGEIIIIIRRDLLEVKLNLKIIISKDSFNALFVVKFPVIRKI